MKKLNLLCAGTLCACVLAAQPSFQTSLEAGISLPLNSNGVNDAHAGKAIHFGNHLDYSFGQGAVRFGLGAYIGYINSISADNKYKEIGESIAERYRFAASQLSFNSASFKSTHILLGPIASFGSGKCNINIWAKAGYGLNEPSRYAVMYKENGVVNNIYINQAGESKNGLAYSLGAGIRYALSEYTGMRLSANYFSTQTDQVNYNFDREKGISPLYYTAGNQFIQVSAGLQFNIGNPAKRTKAISSAGPALSDTGNPAVFGQKMKTKSNIKNDRLMNTAGDNGNDNGDNDSLFFSPQKIELGSRIPDLGMSRVRLQAVDNYLTGFVYQTPAGNVLSQCGSNAMPGDPVPGIDVKLKRTGTAANDLMTARTNRDGSFAFNNITAGDYNAEAGNTAIPLTVNGDKENDFKILDINAGSCGNLKENYIISAGDKTYVEVISAREASSGMATGKKHIGNVKYNEINAIAPRDAASGMATGRRMHKPYRVTDMDFTVNMENIVTSDGKLYAEVITAREASSGMASGRRTIVTGDLDGDGMTEYTVVSPRDAASGMPTGRRMHKPFVITKELDYAEDANEIVSPRDAASGMPTGKRMHKPFVITVDYDEENAEIISPRDASSGMATGRRMHKPYIIRIDPDADSYEIISPRDAASGMPTGKRMHKPFVITKELGFNEEGNAVAIYKIVHRDLSARNMAGADDDEAGAEKMAITEQGVPRTKGHKKGIITGKDNDTGMYADRDAATGLATGRRLNKAVEDGYDSWDDNEEEAVVSNPLYESSGAGGENPLFESRDALRVSGGNGKGHDIFIPSNFMILQGGQPLAQNASYELGPVKWMAPESLTRARMAKGISEKGIKKNETATRKTGDGTVKNDTKNINTSEANVGTGKGYVAISGNGTAGKGIQEKGIKKNETAVRKGWDGTVKGGAVVKAINRVHCADGTCSIDATIEVDGEAYDAVITGVMARK